MLKVQDKRLPDGYLEALKGDVDIMDRASGNKLVVGLGEPFFIEHLDHVLTHRYGIPASQLDEARRQFDEAVSHTAERWREFYRR